MRAVGLKTLKNQLSEYVRLVETGETVLVTRRDRVVAELVPVRPGRADSARDALLADLVRHGWLRPPLTSPESPLPERRPTSSLSRILGELEEDRKDR